MRRPSSISSFSRIAVGGGSFALLLAGAALALPPTPVSPAGAVADRCPTFSWSLAEAAGGYELVVYGVDDQGAVAEAPQLTASLPAGAQSWTPPADRCLSPGGRYAWAIRGLAEEEPGDWSPATLVEVSAAPTVGEVEAAMETLRRHLEARADVSSTRGIARGGGTEPEPSVASLPAQGTAGLRDRALSSPQLETAASTQGAPTLGTASLTLSDQVHLATDSDVFKDGQLFLWDDTSGNLALGQNALMSVSGTATNNTAVGRGALQNNTTGQANTSVGFRALYSGGGGHNTAVGYEALRDNLVIFNTAVGHSALAANTFGQSNVALGWRALWNNTQGSTNTALGYQALINSTTGYGNIGIGDGAGLLAPDDANRNVFIANAGDSGDTTPTIRIGSDHLHTRTFIAGIHGATLAGGDEQDVCVDAEDQLGPCGVSSERFKEQITELDDLGDRVLELRPVSFRYRPGILGGPERPRLGLVAEEVAELFPELVTRDPEGRPFAVRYELLSVLLLDELQRASGDLETVHERLSALERGENPGGKRRPPWWRRLRGGEASLEDER